MIRRIPTLLTGIIIGIAIMGGCLAVAAGIVAHKAAYNVVLDGETIDIEAYSIEGRTYIQLRDLAEEMDFRLWWDEATRTAYIDTNYPYDPEYTGPNPGDPITIPPQPTNQTS